jgi:hypothetical protein
LRLVIGHGVKAVLNVKIGRVYAGGVDFGRGAHADHGGGITGHHIPGAFGVGVEALGAGTVAVGTGAFGKGLEGYGHVVLGDHKAFGQLKLVFFICGHDDGKTGTIGVKDFEEAVIVALGGVVIAPEIGNIPQGIKDAAVKGHFGRSLKETVQGLRPLAELVMGSPYAIEDFGGGITGTL